MIALGVVVRDELANDDTEMALAERDDVPKAFLLDGANEAFREGIEIRAPRRQSHQRDPRGSQQALELRCVQRVSIDDQVAEASQRADLRVRQIAGRVGGRRPVCGASRAAGSLPVTCRSVCDNLRS